MVGHPQTKGRATGENKLRPKPPRHSSTLLAAFVKDPLDYFSALHVLTASLISARCMSLPHLDYFSALHVLTASLISARCMSLPHLSSTE